MKNKLTALFLGLAFACCITGCGNKINDLKDGISSGLQAIESAQNTSGTSTEVSNNTSGSENADATGDASPSAATSTNNDSMGLYQDFLAGKVKLYTEKKEFTAWDVDTYEEISYYGKNDGFTLPEFLKHVLQMESVYSITYLDALSYTYFDAGHDGDPELCLEADFRQDAYYGTTKQFIIKNIDGKLQLCAQLSGGEAYYESLGNKSGLISVFNEGSDEFRFIDKNGDEHFLYSYSMGTALWTLEPPLYSRIEEVETDMDLESYDFYIEYYHLKPYSEYYNDDDPEGSYEKYAKDSLYCCDSKDYGYDAEQAAKNEKFMTDLFAIADMKLYSKDEINEILDNRFKEVGADRGMTEEYDEFDWETLSFDYNDINGVKEVTVDNVNDLMNALGPKTTVYLAPGQYNVTDWCKEQIEKGTIEERYVYDESTDDIIETDYYGSEPKFYYTGLSNNPGVSIFCLNSCTIASADPKNPASIVSTPRDENVLSFVRCSSLTIDNVIMGHTDGNDSCSGDVLAIDNCYYMNLKNCDLYGCGATALDITGGYSIIFEECVIHDCTVGCLYAYNTNYINFIDTKFLDVDGYTMFYLVCSDVDFTNCTFNNLTGTFLSLDESAGASFNNCTMDDQLMNEVQEKINSGYRVFVD